MFINKVILNSSIDLDFVKEFYKNCVIAIYYYRFHWTENVLFQLHLLEKILRYSPVIAF